MPDSHNYVQQRTLACLPDLMAAEGALELAPKTGESLHQWQTRDGVPAAYVNLAVEVLRRFVRCCDGLVAAKAQSEAEVRDAYSALSRDAQYLLQKYRECRFAP